MIVKIWPIKADYANKPGKVGGVEGLKNALNYISDANKVAIRRSDLQDILQEEFLEDYSEYIDANTNRVIEYMSNEDKVKGKYVSGYLCQNPENAVAEFNFARAMTLAKADIERDVEEGAVAFHLVQSFPDNLDISDEEVHQCGLELCEKLKKHQAIICSHVHPQIDEMSGEISGKCKHNHILINAYIHPDYYDEKYPKRVKYNDCKETYAQLRVWNDEIAINHGLPIIRNPDELRIYSWKENNEINKGLSWKDQIRMDIETTRRICTNWDEFVEMMENAGYKIKGGAHTTYTAPDGIHKVRGSTLGREYERDKLEFYWSVRTYGEKAVQQNIQQNEIQSTMDKLESISEQATVAVPIGRPNSKNYYYLPLTKKDLDRDTLYSYFDTESHYDICNNKNQPIMAVSGAEIIQYYEDIKRDKNIDKLKSPEEEYYEEQEKKKYYIDQRFKHSRTKRSYRTELYDEDGRRRTTLELIFLLALTVIRTESSSYTPSSIPPGKHHDVLYAPTDWKSQNMIESIYTASEMDLRTPAEIQGRLKEVGSAVSRARKTLSNTVRAKEKMDMISAAIKDYKMTKDAVERLLDLPEGEEKVSLQEQHKEMIEKYSKAKHTLYKHNLVDDNKIREFENRYEQIQKDISEKEQRFDDTKEEYRKLKKLEHNTKFAQNTQYCYGPEYVEERTEEKEEKSLSNENDREVGK